MSSFTQYSICINGSKTGNSVVDLEHPKLHKIFINILCSAIYLLHCAYTPTSLYVLLDCSGDSVPPPSRASKMGQGNHA